MRNSLEEIAQRVNPVVRGWVVYYGHFYRSAMRREMEQIDMHLVKWIVRKHKRVHGSQAKPGLFAHWDLER